MGYVFVLLIAFIDILGGQWPGGHMVEIALNVHALPEALFIQKKTKICVMF